jgi:DNA-binding NarL/FixJ family response regulator
MPDAGRSVLIVDDHAPFRAAARMLLEGEGFEVVGEGEDVAGTLAAAVRLRPAIVLLDIGLPDGDGFEVCDGSRRRATATKRAARRRTARQVTYSAGTIVRGGLQLRSLPEWIGVGVPRRRGSS